ncbi:DUF6479 family protein [Kitasatospora sp. NBC_00240]|uniref:DUF6479 family protein n=1 Tax=Kitasatospora sp. NBC_00240 TaxID=2903567 RepID=UPI00225A23F1|nr:DUF6479 family protein [Kitasatospora sp. NBC_00240]MCX5215269.1 DUF6479 family protein [Kitasatospora sp. NBC_00240]
MKDFEVLAAGMPGSALALLVVAGLVVGALLVGAFVHGSRRKDKEPPPVDLQAALSPDHGGRGTREPTRSQSPDIPGPPY